MKRWRLTPDEMEARTRRLLKRSAESMERRLAELGWPRVAVKNDGDSRSLERWAGQVLRFTGKPPGRPN